MLKKEEYDKSIRRPYPPFMSSMFMEGYRNPENFLALVHQPFCERDLIIQDGYWYYRLTDRIKAGRVTFRDWMSPKSFKQAKKELYRREKTLIKATTSNLRRYSRAFIKYTPAVIVAWEVDPLVAKKVRQLLEKTFGKTDAEILLNQLNVPFKNNFYKQEEYDLIMTKNLKEHVKRYEWLNSRYGERQSYTFTEAKEKLEKIDKANFLKKWWEDKLILRRAIKKAKNGLGKDGHIIDLMQFIVYYRTQRTDIINKSMYLFGPLFNKMAQSLKLSYRQLLHCTIEEITEGVPSKRIINSRLRDYALIMEKGKIGCVIGKESQQIRKYLVSKEARVKQFTGVIACRGRVRGKVKLIFSKEDFHKINIGDILVTSMTTPPMVQIMKTAVAFITDEGGITSHAAIISREMNKPCIMATKIATKVLKDGQLVEVDANKGVVKILKK